MTTPAFLVLSWGQVLQGAQKCGAQKGRKTNFERRRKQFRRTVARNRGCGAKVLAFEPGSLFLVAALAYLLALCSLGLVCESRPVVQPRSGLAGARDPFCILRQHVCWAAHI
uniref:Uncharacterized protein n=1 Tax=Ixodes ricinus TaxID=34613 RepID=A0A6B0UK19_IXORI